MSGLRIGFPYVGDRYGGSNESSLVMAQALQDRGHRPVIIAHGEGRVGQEAAKRGLEVVTLPRLSSHESYARSSGAKPEQFLAMPSCYRIARQQRLDIVHTNDLTMLRTWAAPARLAGAKYIAHWRAASKVSLSVSYGFALAQRIISVSDYSKAYLPDWAKRKTIVEFNSLDTFLTQADRDAARAAVRTRLAIPQDSVLVAIFGNLTRRKRSHVLADIIEAIEHDPAGRPVYGLICGGRAEPLDTELFEKIERKALSARILMPGFVRPVQEWMGACDIILAPAEREPLARNVLEAQAAGVAVIVSSDGGLIELVNDQENGIILPPGDIAGWIAAVKMLLADEPLRNRLAAAGQATVRPLTPALHAARIEEIYRAAGARF